jgi:hypothetical protein
MDQLSSLLAELSKNPSPLLMTAVPGLSGARSGYVVQPPAPQQITPHLGTVSAPQIGHGSNAAMDLLRQMMNRGMSNPPGQPQQNPGLMPQASLGSSNGSGPFGMNSAYWGNQIGNLLGGNPGSQWGSGAISLGPLNAPSVSPLDLSQFTLPSLG